MKQVVVGTENLKELFPDNESIQPFEMNGFKMTVGLIEVNDIVFDPYSKENEERVLVRIKAFSCNYRDKGLMMQYMHMMNTEWRQNEDKVLYKAFGSDFMGEIVSVGTQVTKLKPGDRVISNATFPYFIPGTTAGIPSNNSSKEYEIFHHTKLMKIPAEITDEIGAAFTIGAITAYSMVRKLNLQDGDSVLVTAAKSNTSLFVLNALKKYKNVDVYATSTTNNFADKIEQMNVKELMIIDPTLPTFIDNPQVLNVLKQRNKLFNKVIDPFFDLHLGKLTSVMDHFCRYITCGRYDQYDVFLDPGQRIEEAQRNINIYKIFSDALIKNIEIYSNCLGLQEDLEQAVKDSSEGIYTVNIDSAYTGTDVKGFLEKTYNDKARFGKVVYIF